MTPLAQESLRILATGFTVGFGPCLAFCAPIVLPIIATTADNHRQGLTAALVFSLGRALSYIFLGLLAGWSIRLLDPVLNEPGWKLFFSLASGSLLLLFGGLILLGKDTSLRYCRNFHKYFVDKRQPSMFILGILIGFTPCLPLLGILTYIANRAANAWQGAVMGASFGLGTLVSPLLLAGMLAGAVPGKLDRLARIQKLFNQLCALLLILWGILLLLRR